MQASAGTINSEQQKNSETCKEGHRRKLQREAYRCYALSLNKKFTAYRQELERVEFFKYLGRILTYDNNDIQDVRSNLNKAPKVCGMIYKAMIQAVLLYGSES